MAGLKKQSIWQLVGAVFTLLAGTLLHFTYELSGKSRLVGFLSPVNESVWEHLKLIAVPICLFALIEYLFYGKKVQNFCAVKVLSILIAMLLTLILYYLYSGIAGKNYLIADITIFVICTVSAYIFSCRTLGSNKFSSKYAKGAAKIAAALLIAAFLGLTVNPPKIALFRDPETGTYGRKEESRITQLPSSTKTTCVLLNS